jgi:hypothetical protein
LVQVVEDYLMELTVYSVPLHHKLLAVVDLVE